MTTKRQVFQLGKLMRYIYEACEIYCRVFCWLWHIRFPFAPVLHLHDLGNKIIFGRYVYNHGCQLRLAVWSGQHQKDHSGIDSGMASISRIAYTVYKRSNLYLIRTCSNFKQNIWNYSHIYKIIKSSNHNQYSLWHNLLVNHTTQKILPPVT